MRTRRPSAIALLATLVGVAALAACGSSGSTAAGSSTSEATTSTASTTATSSSNSAAGSTSTTRSSAGGACVAAQLKVSLGEGGAAAGSRYQTIVLTNTGSTGCTLTGYPGVSLQDASGARIGQPAGREAGTVAPVSLAAGGGQASFFIHTTADLGGTGCQAQSTTIAVIAPGDTTTMTLPGEVTVCGSFNASPVVAGTTGHS